MIKSHVSFDALGTGPRAYQPNDVSTILTPTLTATWTHTQSQCRMHSLMGPPSEHCQPSAILFLRLRKHKPVRSIQIPSPPPLLIRRKIDSELITKRRLGQTNLAVKPGQVGTSNATKPENLGPFDYAHLRAPLPRNLKGSEIFAPHQNQPTPEVYFLMVRVSELSLRLRTNR